MTPRSTPATSIPSAPRLWALGSILLVGAAAAAFSVSALAGGPRGMGDGRGPHAGHHGEACMQGGMGAHHGGGMMGDARHLDRLLGDAHKLSDAQRSQIRDIQTQARTDLMKLHDADRPAMHPGMALLTQAKPDAAAAEKARQDMLARHDKASQRMLKAQLDVANVLTPAQRAQLATALKDRQERMHDRMHDRMGQPHERAEHRALHHAAPAASQPAPRASAAR